MFQVLLILNCIDALALSRCNGQSHEMDLSYKGS
jgi:hypothetical protein